MRLMIGLAMLQGARHEHAQALRAAADELGVVIEIVELRSAGDVHSQQLDALARRRLSEARVPALISTFRRATRLEAQFWQMGLDQSA